MHILVFLSISVEMSPLCPDLLRAMCWPPIDGVTARVSWAARAIAGITCLMELRLSFIV
jgi:hypothetical protein